MSRIGDSLHFILEILNMDQIRSFILTNNQFMYVDAVPVEDYVDKLNMARVNYF